MLGAPEECVLSCHRARSECNVFTQWLRARGIMAGSPVNPSGGHYHLLSCFEDRIVWKLVALWAHHCHMPLHLESFPSWLSLTQANTWTKTAYCREVYTRGEAGRGQVGTLSSRSATTSDGVGMCVRWLLGECSVRKEFLGYHSACYRHLLAACFDNSTPNMWVGIFTCLPLKTGWSSLCPVSGGRLS